MEVKSEEEMNPIKFLRKHSKNLLQVSRFVLSVLGVAATSAPVERVLSHGGLIIKAKCHGRWYPYPTILSSM